MKLKEITFEITNYCPHSCKYCSSNAINDFDKALFLNISKIEEFLKGKYYEKINLSGGEPLSHPNFYRIFTLCKKHSDDVIVYSNLITHLRYNANVIDGVYLEANLTITPETDKIHILRRVKQWKELNRPEVHLSRNYFENCSCDHKVIIPSGEITLTPCNKYSNKKFNNVYLNKFYIVGAHGVGKSTIITDLNTKFKLEKYHNTTKNPYKKDIFRRQLWRLMKYIADDELIRIEVKKMIINRCCLDWLIYTKTFKDLGWLTSEEYKILLEKYNEYFKDNLPENIIYINPILEWSKKRIKERWKKQGMKWKEDDFIYYDILRNNYDKIIHKMKDIENIIEINEINRVKRIDLINKAII